MDSQGHQPFTLHPFVVMALQNARLSSHFSKYYGQGKDKVLYCSQERVPKKSNQSTKHSVTIATDKDRENDLHK